MGENRKKPLVFNCKILLMEKRDDDLVVYLNDPTQNDPEPTFNAEWTYKTWRNLGMPGVGDWVRVTLTFELPNPRIELLRIDEPI